MTTTDGCERLAMQLLAVDTISDESRAGIMGRGGTE